MTRHPSKLNRIMCLAGNRIYEQELETRHVMVEKDFTLKRDI